MTTAMVVGVYVPFIVPVVLVAAAFVTGVVLQRGDPPRPFSRRVAQLVPLLMAGIAAVVVSVVWLATRWTTIQGFTSTVYPGERLQRVGEGGWLELSQLFSAFLSVDLARKNGQPLSMNMSEASTFFLPGLFLAVVVVWLLLVRWRSERRIDPLFVALLTVGVVMFAFLLVPGWDAVAHVLMLDRTTSGRMRIGFGVLSFVLVIVVGRALDDRARQGEQQVPRWVPLAGMALTLASMGVVAWRIREATGVRGYLAGSDPEILVVLALVTLLYVSSVGLFARGWVTAGGVAVLIVSVASTAGVNPLYRGVLDLRETETVQTVQAIDQEDPGTWVGITSSSLPMMMLVQSGVTALNGFQGAPSLDMWEEIDPTGASEEHWNRLGMVSWVLGAGDPAPRNPYPDQVQMTFDPCAPFAQENVTWVLSEVPIDSSCVTLADEVQEGPTTMRIYEVAK